MIISNAFPFYLIIIFTSVILMTFSQKWVCGKLVKFRNLFFVSSFIPLWYVSAFTSSGADYEQYAYICYDAAFRIQESYTEIGWNLLSLALTFITEDPYKTLFIIQTIVLSLYGYAFYLIRKDVSLWLSLLAFDFFLFYNFGLMSIYLSIALVLISVIKYTHNNKKSSLLFLILATSCHSSAMFWIPVYIFSFFSNKYGWSLKGITLLLLFGIIFFVGMIGTLLPKLLNMPMFQHYSSYGFEGGMSLGLGNLVLYVIYIYLLFNFITNRNFLYEKRFLLILLFVSFAYMLLGYMIPTVTRMKLYGVFITAFFIPKALKVKNNIYKLFIWVLFILIFGGFGLYKTIMTENYLMSSWIYFNPW